MTGKSYILRRVPDLLPSALIPGADDGKVAITRAKVMGMKDFLVVHKTHTFIMRDRKVIDQVIFFINNGLFKKDCANNTQKMNNSKYHGGKLWNL